MSSAMQFVASTAYSAYIFLPFSFFDNVKNAIPTSFVEPIKIRVHFSDCGNIAMDTSSNVLTPTLSEGRLLCEYRVLDNEDEDATIQANYDNVLTQLHYDYETEAPVVGTLTNSAELELKKSIQSNAVVSDMYIIVSADISQQSSPAKALLSMSEIPLILQSIQFQASGQNVVPQIDAKYIQLYGRRCVDGKYFLGNGGDDSTAGEDPACVRWVYKIQFGLDKEKGYNSGGISLRELNNPEVIVKVFRTGAANNNSSDQPDVVNPTGNIAGSQNDIALASAKVSLRVVLRHHTLISCDPSSGRLNNMLTN
tara:strand:+ start:62 stop:991 length:930 start_codon:yes stop_codon:yes gene_type:complete